MNKRILTRVISFVLVLCLLVPIIPDFGIDLAGVTADAAYTDARYFKAGSGNYGYYDAESASWKKGTSDSGCEAFAINGVTYIPTELISAAFGNIGVDALKTNELFLKRAQDVKNANGDTVECIAAIDGDEIYTGYYVNISNMNLIAVDTTDTVFSDMSNDTQILIMKRFLFDHLTDYESNTSFSLYSALTASSSCLTDLSHPYIMADQTEFDYLHRQWSGELESGETQDEVLKEYLDFLVAEADGIYAVYSTDDDGALNTAAGCISGQDYLYEMPYSSNNGYDSGGRQNESAYHTLRISKLAYAYQVTRYKKYATLALNYAEAISQWEHWGVGHFLNAADAAYSMALAYDWCYNVWKETDSAKMTAVRNALFTKGVVSGVISSYRYNVPLHGSTTQSSVYCPWYNSVFGQSGFVYQNRENNWSGVCSSGMIIASLALITDASEYASITISNKQTNIASSTNTALSSYQIGTEKLSGIVGGTTVKEACVWLINNNLCHLEALGLKQYIPDGSYIESASYWSYGTNAVLRAAVAMRTALGTDFGLSSAWGLDTTALFSYYVQSSDGDVWKYHDHSGDGSLDTSLNGIYGAVTGDDGITAYRKYLITKGVVTPTMYDTFAYDAGVDAEDIALMPLDRYMEGIQGYAVRDSWESGSIYAAFMGGEYIADHGQIDSGAFVYYNNGVRWLQDIGCDNYSVYNYGYGKLISSLKYYPTSAEGNNTVCTDSFEYGQYVTFESNGTDITQYGSAEITKHVESGAAGSYAILDQSAAFTGKATSARRGLLFTNDRSTVVIQDEISFNPGLTKFGSSDAHTAYWFAHVSDAIDITLSADGKTAYLTDGETVIRCSIVTGNDDTASAVFTVMDCAYSAENILLSGTDDTGNYSTDNGGGEQKQYDAWQKLTVACCGVTDMKLAVVIEELAPGDNHEVGYTWTDMDSWSASADPNNYDGKVLLYKNFDDTGIGSFESESGNFRYANTLVDGDNAMGMYSTSSSRSSSVTLAAAGGKVEHASIGDGLLVAELDVRQLESLVTADGSARLELWGTDIYPNVSLELTSLGLSDEWSRVTVVIDEATDDLYVYVNDDLKTVDLNYRSRSYEDLKLVISADGSFSQGKLLIDNVVIRTYTAAYTELDAYMKDEATGSAGISGWEGKSCELSLGGSVAKLYTTDGPSTDADGDSPFVDFWTSDTVASETETQASICSDAVFADSVSDLETKINSGEYKYAELLIPVTSPLSIEKPITVNTKGYKFYATSDSLICSVTNGSEYTYKEGTLRVSYVVNGVVYTVDVNNSLPFSMDVSDVFTASTIREGRNSDGTYRYVMTQPGCWSRENGGEILDENELIVTSANAKFFLTGAEYGGIFVTVGSDGTITGYTEDQASEFTAAIKSAHKRISVTNSFRIDDTSDGDTGHDVYTNTNIYLNGYTVTYYSGDVSDHLFALGEGKTLNVYGPGAINVEATQSNLVMHGNYSQSNFNNVTITAVYNLTDVRMGMCSFNNCDIYSAAKSHALSVTNRYNSVDNSITDVTRMGILRLNGGSVRYTGTSRAIYVKDNSRLVLEGGVTVIAPDAGAAVLLEQSNGTQISADMKGNVDHIRVYLGEVYFDADNVFGYSANVSYPDSTSQTDHASVFSGKIFYVEGAAFAARDLEYGVASSDYNDDDAVATVGEHVLARTGSAGYSWMVVRAENASLIEWNGDSADVTEYWVKGSVPYATEEARSALADGNAYNMYSLHGGTLKGGESYVFASTEKADLDIRMSVSLNSDFEINFFVEYTDGIEYIMVNGEKVDKSSLKQVTLNVNGEDAAYYAVVIDDIAPHNADQLFSVVVNVADGVHVTAVSSILNYANSILKSAEGGAITPKLKKLMSAIVEYIGSAAAYSGDRITEASCRLIADAYADSKNDIRLNADQPDTSAVSGAVRSAYLELGAKPGFAFRFRLDFSGTLKISYVNFRGATVTETVTVANGMVGGGDTDIYTLAMKAYDMGSDLTITAFDESGESIGSCSYGIGAYYTVAVEANGTLCDLLTALEAYTVTAREYTMERYGIA